MDKLIVVITTKNRPELFEKAVNFVVNQTKKADEIVVISDSIQTNYEIENKICVANNCTLIVDRFTHNYAGSLNTSLDYLTKKYYIDQLINPHKIILAFLDDDDYWDSTYLEKCFKAIGKENDFVVSGLFYTTDEKSLPLSIPTKITSNSFLSKNPHIQGSNTFIRMDKILEAGCFDENMSSTTDRDIFTRVLMLTTKYSVVNEHLVHIDAKDARPRLTNASTGKRESLSKFFSKYGGLMDDAEKRLFFERTKRYSEIDENEIGKVLEFRPSLIEKKAVEIKQYPKVLIGFIASSLSLCNRLLHDIRTYGFKDYEVLIIKNFHEDCLFRSDNEKVIRIDEIKKNISNNLYGDFVNKKCLNNDTITNIACARSILHYHLYEESTEDEVIWILDDDMELYEIFNDGVHEEKKKTGFYGIVNEYIHKIDVFIGSYSLDAPLPTFSTLRTSLLDFTYAKVLQKNKFYDNKIKYLPDYYYDLSETSNVHLETPLPIKKDITIDDVFSGKAISRPLFITNSFETEPFSRGGNTIVFNKEVLKIPNISLQFGNFYARRSDYFWTLLVKKYGYKIKQVSFSTLHNKEKCAFDYKKEIDKELSDLVGSSFTKAYKAMKGTTRTEFYTLFVDYYNKRLTRFVDSYYRIIGLLKINGDEKYSQDINEENLSYLINKFKEMLNPALIESSFDYLNSLILDYDNSLKVERIKKEISEVLSLDSLKYLGSGNEGIVFKDNEYVHKYFTSLDQMLFLRNVSTLFSGCPQLESLQYFFCNGHLVIKYKQEGNYEPYISGHALELADLISFLKTKGLVLTNIKRTNFILLDGKLKFIDYGKNISSFTEESFNTSLERAFQMLKYPDISIAEYKQMISLSYMNKAKEINFGMENFIKLVQHRYKEQLHDSYVINEIKEAKPNTLLDYGAGKCKIANYFREKISVSVFDIDYKTIHSRASKNVRIVEDINKDNEKYDLVNCNLVLCCIDDTWNDFIIKKIHYLLNENGTLVLSICNPFFNYVQHTELRSSGLQGPYDVEEEFDKETPYGIRKEFHRPFEYYENLLQRNGFQITKLSETDGVNVDSLNNISEQLVLTCKKVEVEELKDVSLLIKTNAMEYKIVYEEIRHIVSQLERGISFHEKVVVVDDEIGSKNREFSEQSLLILESELERTLKNKLIDRIIYSSDANVLKVYEKFFSSNCVGTHSQNGQQLLASLYGFSSIKTRYVFQTDSDIIFFNNWNSSLFDALQILKQKQAFSLSLSIARNDESISIGDRTEVRNSLIDLKRLIDTLPLNNPIENDKYSLPWHRCIDNTYLRLSNIRLSSKDLFFVHPENQIKKNQNFVNIVKNRIEESEFFEWQKDHVDLVGGMDEWIKKTNSEMVLFIRGRNTIPEKIKRLFDSIKKQTIQDFQILYVDDNSIQQDKDYAKTLFRYDPYFKGKVISVFNSVGVGALENEETFLKACVKDSQSIIVNIDNDDCLLTDDALEIIQNEFDHGADVTVGNCFRSDKPFNKYKVYSFENVINRNGDNIWIHPKCFRRYLFNYAIPYLKKDGKYIDVCTDYTMMLPIVKKANHPVFIEKRIYYFEPSKENSMKEGKYMKSLSMKKYLIEKQKEESLVKTISVIGDGNLDADSSEYQFAYELGKALVDHGYIIQSGGLGGVMEAVFKGAHASKKYSFGKTIGILPSNNEKECNPYCDIVVPTGLDLMRNGLVIKADAVIAIGGGAGTLSEIAMAWEEFKLIIGIIGFGGWSEKIAGQKLDKRIRYASIKEDSIYGATNTQDVLELLIKNIDLYTRKHHGISYKNQEKIDLDFDFHSHTSPESSCAKQTITDSILHAKESGVNVLAITNHNTIKNLDIAKKTGLSNGVSIVNGVEMSTRTYDIDPSIPSWWILHVLGLNIDDNSELFEKRIVKKKSKAKEICKFLKGKYPLLNTDEISQKADIYNYLITNGYVSNKQEAKKLFKDERINEFFPQETLNIKDTISLIHDLHGLAVWAHPCRAENHVEIKRNQIDVIIKYMVECGLDGIEVYHYSNFESGEVEHLLALTKKYHLLVSLGSDNHFVNEPYFSLKDKLDKSIDLKRIEEEILKGGIK